MGPKVNAVDRNKTLFNTLQNNLSDAVQELERLVVLGEDEEPPEAFALKVKRQIALIESKLERFGNCENELLKTMEEDDDLKLLYNQAETCRDRATIALSDARSVLKNSSPTTDPKERRSVSPSEASSSSSNRVKLNVKLPEVSLPTFDGKLTEFPAFWDHFCATVDNLEDLPDVQKFAYLKSSLTGEAAKTILGLNITDTNYPIAVGILKSVYDRPELLRQAYWSQLHKIPAAKSMDVKDIRATFNNIEICLRTLESLKQINPSEPVSDGFLPLFVIGKFPQPIIEGWERHCTTFKNSTLADVREYLKREIETREAARAVAQSHTSSHVDARPIVKPKYSAPCTSSSFSATEGRDHPRDFEQNPVPSPRGCACCSATVWHRLLDCLTFKTMSPNSRQKFVKEHRLCYNCLSSKHGVKFCNHRGRCKICASKHHSLLHFEPLSNKCTPDRSLEVLPSVSADRPSVSTFQKRQPTDSSPLNPFAPPFPFRDTSCVASSVKPPKLIERSSISEPVINRTGVLMTATVRVRLGSQFVFARLLVDGGSERSHVRSDLAANFRPIEKRTFITHAFGGGVIGPKVSSLHEITLLSRHDDYEHKLRFWSSDLLCQSIPAPCSKFVPSEWHNFPLADILDGMNPSIDLIVGGDQFWEIMYPEITKIGHVVAQYSKFGFVLSGSVPMSDSSRVLLNFSRTYFAKDFDAHWGLESIGIRMGDEREEYESLPIPKYDVDTRRYRISLPWLDASRPTLNRIQAETRHLNLRNACARSFPKVTLSEYEEAIQKLLLEGVIEEIDVAKAKFFLPHHGVRRPDKPVRIVFDGSAGINSYLKTGPNLLPKLLDVVLKTRSSPILIQGDVKSAFHQIEVDRSDCPFLAFRWGERTFQFIRVPFGLCSSPWILNSTLSFHISSLREEFPVTCDQILQTLYVDDIHGLCDTLENARKFKEESSIIFGRASMELHKWNCTGDPRSDSLTYILGLLWDTNSDSLSVNLNLTEQSYPPTRRGLARSVASIFDPLGLLSPWSVRGRLFLQESWEKGSWDTPLASALLQKWKTWLNEANQFPSPCVSRYLEFRDTLDLFSDASTRVVSTVAYVSSPHGSHLLLSRSRSAPTKSTTTIPRLELAAAVLSVRVLKFLRSCLHFLVNIPVTLWTDSMVVLGWIRTKDPSSLSSVYVRNRITEICQHSTPDMWKYCPTSLNPADLPTRGCSLSQLTSAVLWWQGPPFLSSRIYPHEPSPRSEDPNTENVPTTPTSQHCVVEVDAVECETTWNEVIDLNRFSKYKTLRNVVGWCLRYVHNSRCSDPSSKQSGPLQLLELDKASDVILKCEQRRVYPKEVEALKSGRPVTKSSPLIYLHPFLDTTNGVLKVRPRSREEAIPFLPRGRLADLLIRHYHLLNFHCGASQTMSSIQQDFCLFRTRETVKRALKECCACRRYRAIPYRTCEADLPSTRVEPCRPFSRCGIDFFGPCFAPEKCWVLLIVCMVTRAIHLELCESQSVEDSSLALRRFFSRRGTPSIAYSDNARTFKLLSSFLHPVVHWRFNPASAPWWGGHFERLVGVTKRALRPALHHRRLSFVELSTILAEVEYCVNCRPLTYVVEAEATLTPNHFLLGMPPGVKMEDVPVSPPKFSHLWKEKLAVTETLWKRWRNEYLVTLRPWRSVPTTPSNPQLGDVVLVKDPGNRSGWPLARVVSLVHGRDKSVRAVNLLLRGHHVSRPIEAIYSLEGTETTTSVENPSVLTTESETQPPLDTPEESLPVLPNPDADIDQIASNPWPKTSRGRCVRLPQRFQ